MMQINFLNEQTIYDAFFMSKPEFVKNYLEYFPQLTEMEAKIIQSGIIEEFEYIKRGYKKSNQLDETKFAEWKNVSCLKLTEKESILLKVDEKRDIAKKILEDDVEYKWQSDKIKALLKNKYTHEEIIKLFDYKINASYIKKYDK